MKKTTFKNGIIACGGEGKISEESMHKIESFTEKINEWKKIRTDSISEMFDNVDDCGIYPTGEFFKKIDKAYVEALNYRGD